MADQADLRSEALKIVKAKPEAVFFAIFNQIALAGRALIQLHYSGKKYASILDSVHVDASLGTLEGTKVFLFNPAGKNFTERFQTRFKKTPGIFADTAYDAVRSLAAAIFRRKVLKFPL